MVVCLDVLIGTRKDYVLAGLTSYVQRHKCKPVSILLNSDMYPV